MERKNRYQYVGFFLFGLLFSACVGTTEIAKTNLATLPEHYTGSTDTSNVATINWRNYFTDPVLIGLIDTALNNNLDLLMATQRIEMARANVMFAKGLAFPSVTAIGAAGQQKFGDYTMNAAGNRGTPIYQEQTIP